MRIATNAKVNLHLRVLGTRPDGYHEIETILSSVSFADELEVALTEGSIEVEMISGGSILPERLPAAADNIAAAAARALLSEGVGARISITKNIPIGAGLGGGSANAAGVIVALRELAELDLDDRAAAVVAAAVGSDVVFCLDGGTALATSRGEELTRLPAPAEMFFVLGITDAPLWTRDVYAAYDKLGSSGEGPSGAPMALALGGGDIEEIAELVHNDLAPAAVALMPELADKRDALAGAGVAAAEVSGSGPTIFGLCSDAATAERAAAAVEAIFDRVVVTRSAGRCVQRLD